MDNDARKFAWATLIITVIGTLFLGWIGFNQLRLTEISNDIQESQKLMTQESIKNTIIKENINPDKIQLDLGVSFTDYKNGNLDEIRKLYGKSILPETKEEDRFMSKISQAVNGFEVVLIKFEENNFDNKIITNLYGDTIKNLYNLMTVQFSDKTIKDLKESFGDVRNFLDIVISQNKKNNTTDLVYFIKTADALFRQ